MAGTIALSCDRCGAGLDVPEGQRFVTCAYCGTRLEVRREGNVAFTAVQEAVARLDRKADELAHDLEEVKLRQQLQELDRAWDEQRAGLMLHTKEGPREPTMFAAWTAWLGGAVVLVVICAAALGGSGARLDLLGVGLLAALIVEGWGVYVWSRARAYRLAEAEYRAERDELEQRLADSG
jgi:DNA-directed RNA polymerase subunit RPC12/RpoP